MTTTPALLHPPAVSSTDECSYTSAWAGVLASALDNNLADALIMNSTKPWNVLMSMVDELRRLAATQRPVRTLLAKVLRQLHQASDCEDSAAELLDELRQLARESSGEAGVTTQFAMALAAEVEDRVLQYEVQTAVALLHELRFDQTNYAETPDSIDARVRALAAVYRALRSPELLAELRALHARGSYVSWARFGQVLVEGKDVECADIFAALTRDLDHHAAERLKLLRLRSAPPAPPTATEFGGLVHHHPRVNL